MCRKSCGTNNPISVDPAEQTERRFQVLRNPSAHDPRGRFETSSVAYALKPLLKASNIKSDEHPSCEGLISHNHPKGRHVEEAGDEAGHLMIIDIITGCGTSLMPRQRPLIRPARG